MIRRRGLTCTIIISHETGWLTAPHGQTELQCTYLSSLSRQWTSIGRIPDFIRSSMGGLRSLDNNFLQKQRGNRGPLFTLSYSHSFTDAWQQKEAITDTQKQLNNVRYPLPVSQSNSFWPSACRWGVMTPSKCQNNAANSKTIINKS